MDADGVDAGVVFPSVGFLMYNIVQDSQFLTAIFRAYNDWLSEFCKPFPNRIKGIALLNVDDVQDGISELERCHKLGLVGALNPVYPPIGKRYGSPRIRAPLGHGPGPGHIHQPPRGHQPSKRGPGAFRFREPYRLLQGQPGLLGTHVPWGTLSSMACSSATQSCGWVRWSMSCPWVPVLPGANRLHLHTGSPEGRLVPLQGSHASQRLFPPERVRGVSARWPGSEATEHYRGGQPDVGLGLPPYRVPPSPEAVRFSMISWPIAQKRRRPRSPARMPPRSTTSN